MRDNGGVKGAVRVILVDKMATECPGHAGFRFVEDYCVQVASQTGPLERRNRRRGLLYSSVVLMRGFVRLSKKRRNLFKRRKREKGMSEAYLVMVGFKQQDRSRLDIDRDTATS